MTFASFETSGEAGTPVEVYEITAGATSFFYTSAEDDQLVGAQTYTAVEGLRRGVQTEGPEKRENEFAIRLPTFDSLAQIFVGVLPGFRVQMQVRRFHRDDTPTPEVIQIFDGFVETAKFEEQGKVTVLVARTALGAVGHTIPRRAYQGSCNHVLYDPLTCKVDDTDPAFRASALSVDSQVSSTLTVAAGLMGTYADGFMNGGFVEVIGVSDFRLILSHTSNDLELHTPFTTTPTLINVFAGCAHTIAVCGSKFDNVIEYGGFAFVPVKNPHQTGLL